MSATIAVVTLSPRWRSAVAELPESTRLGEHAAGALVIVSGSRGWAHRMRAAIDAGASTVVLDAPRLDAAEIREIDREPLGAPVLVHRPRCRPDLPVPDVQGVVPRLVLVECAGSADELSGVLADGVAWARRLGGSGVVRLDATTSRARGGLALLSVGDAIPVTLAAAVTVSPARLRASAMGHERVEVSVGRETVVVHSTGAGAIVVPRALEGAERACLRRALAATDGALELDEFVADAWIARSILDLPSA